MRRFQSPIGMGLLAGLLSVGLFATSCREDLQGPDPATDKASAELLEPAQEIRVPAGSVDALAAALADAGRNGKVVLEAGLHTESAGVVISQRVKLRGEAGAILQVDTAPSLTFPAVVEIALLVREADGTSIEGIDLRPAGAIGGTGIAIQNSDHVAVDRNTFRQHQFSIIVQEGDHTKIRDNTILASTAWMTGDIPESDGIDIVNGRGIHITGNTVTGATLGIFTSGPDGVASKNSASECFIGMILCRIPYETFIFPDGEEVGAHQSCNGWLHKENVATNNLTAGILVIDDAHHNQLINNTGSGNGTYDIELAADSMRFGFLTPRAHDNVVHTGPQPALVVQDCGDRNVVQGTFTDSPDACEVVP